MVVCAWSSGERRGSRCPAGWLWLSNGATSSSESNCNYVYIVAAADTEVADDTSVVAVALSTECLNRLSQSWVRLVGKESDPSIHLVAELLQQTSVNSPNLQE